MGRKVLLLLATAVSTVVLLTGAVIQSVEPEKEWVGYTTAALICISSFCYSSSWL